MYSSIFLFKGVLNTTQSVRDARVLPRVEFLLGHDQSMNRGTLRRARHKRMCLLATAASRSAHTPLYADTIVPMSFWSFEVPCSLVWTLLYSGRETPEWHGRQCLCRLPIMCLCVNSVLDRVFDRASGQEDAVGGLSFWKEFPQAGRSYRLGTDGVQREGAAGERRATSQNLTPELRLLKSHFFVGWLID